MKLHWATNPREAIENTLGFKAAVGLPIAAGSPVTAVQSTVAEVVVSPILVGPSGTAVGSVVSSMLTVVG